ncbi:MAG: RNA-binding protein, partial [Halapricum sp.]
MTDSIKVRGIYTTALTQLLGRTDGFAVVQPSPAIDDRFDREFDLAPADATVWTAEDRQGVGVAGSATPQIRELLADVGRDTLTWADAAPRGAVFDATVTETKG